MVNRGIAVAQAEEVKDPLADWNRLNKLNHENEMARQMYVALLTRLPEQLGNYASWFSAGVGAVVVLLLSNVDKVAPYLGERSYARAIIAFTISVGVGAACKFIGMFTASMTDMQEQVRADMKQGFASFEVEAQKIRVHVAEQNRQDLDPEFDLNALLSKFYSQLGVVTAFFAARGAMRAARSANPILHAYKLPIRYMYFQGLCCLLTVAFAMAGVWCVAGTIGAKALAHGATQPAATNPTTTRSPRVDPVEKSKP